MPEKESRINFLSESNFWGIIHESLAGSKDQKTQNKLLFQLVSKLSEKEMIGFHYHFWRCFFNSYLSELWACAYIALWGCGDSMFDQFRCWVISRGEEVYYNALKNPDTLINEFENLKLGEEPLSSDLFYISSRPFEEKIGKFIGNVVHEKYDDDLKSEWEYKIDLDWGEEEEKLETMCPKTFIKYREKPLKGFWHNK